MIQPASVSMNSLTRQMLMTEGVSIGHEPGLAARLNRSTKRNQMAGMEPFLNPSKFHMEEKFEFSDLRIPVISGM